MASAIPVGLAQVPHPRYIKAVVLDADNPLSTIEVITQTTTPAGTQNGTADTLQFGIENTKLLEVYSGDVILEAQNHGAPTTNASYKFFLPVEPLKIRIYASAAFEKPPIKVAVCVSPSASADDDDEANTVAVNGATASLEQETQLPGTPGGWCLVLTVTIAVLNAIIHRIAYNVTVLSNNPNGEYDIQQIGDTAPQ